MIVKDRPEDFRVVELLNPKTLGEGPHQVYRVAKRKLTTLEAIAEIAREAGVEKSAVSFAGLKDRQGVTVQYVSMEGGRSISIHLPDLKVSFVGRSPKPVDGQSIRGNLFDIVVRSVSNEELDSLKVNLSEVRRFGIPNYFDDQRFGCLRHGQGFIVRELLQKNVEKALQRLLCSASPFDRPAEASFKAALRGAWRSWGRCVSLTKGRHYESLFRHLVEHPDDFVGAFGFVSSRIRLIHLYSYQSYLWNKCVAFYLRERIGSSPFLTIPSDIGPLFCPRSLKPAVEEQIRRETFPLLDSSTKVDDPSKQRAIETVLKVEGVSLDRLQVEGIPGFFLKGEERPLILYPSHIRVKPPVPDERFWGRKKVGLRITLPTGSYATLVLKRLFAVSGGYKRSRRAPFGRLKKHEKSFPF